MLSQTLRIISAIETTPGINRSQLFDIRVNGTRIANLTARITEARRMLAKQ